MTDDIQIASGQIRGAEWDGRTFVAIAICIRAATAEEANARALAFQAEVAELAEAHDGVTMVTEVSELYVTFRRACEVLEKLVAGVLGQIARNQ